LAQFRPSQFRRFHADIVSKNGSPPIGDGCLSYLIFMMRN